MKTIRPLCALIFLAFACTKKTSDTKYIDELQDELSQYIYTDSIPNELKIEKIKLSEFEIKKIPSDTLRVDHLFKIANNYDYANDFENFYRLSREILAETEKNRDTFRMARSHYYLGDYFYRFNVNDSAFYYYTQAEKFYNLSKQFSYNLIDIKLRKAYIYSFIKDYGNSEKLLIEALQTSINMKDYLLQYESYNYLGMILTKTGQYEEAIDYLKKALDIIPRIEGVAEHYHILYAAQTYNNLGSAYQQNQEYQQSIIYFNKGLEEDIQQLFPALHISLENNLAYSRFRLGDQTVYTHLKKNYHDNDSINYAYGKITTNIRLAEYFINQKEFEPAISHAAEAHQLSKEINEFSYQLETLLLLSLVDKNREGVHLREYIRLNDSINNEERKEREKFARIAFETDEISKERELAIAEAEKASTRFWALVGMFIMLLISSTLWYNNKQHKIKNKELRLQQEQQNIKQELYEMLLNQQQKIEEGKQAEKKRISQDLHDGVMGRLSGIRLNLFALKMNPTPETIEKCVPYIEAIQNVEKEIRDISHNLNTIAFNSSNGFENLIQELTLPLESQQIHTEMEVKDEIEWNAINSEKKVEIYRILQEGVQNISKHAQAKKVAIRTFQLKNQILIELEDDGIGFKPKRNSNGIGLNNMKERAKKINCELTIESHLGKGTKLSLRIPT